MNKVELNTLTQVNNNERNFLSALNDNLKRIQAAINDTLSRSGVLPNQMEEVLDMNGKRIVNVGPAVNPTDVVTRQDIQNIIDAANEAIAQLDRLVEDGKIALMTYASEYIYPTCTAAVDACQLAQRKSEDAQGAAEAARDALLLNADYQAIVANLTTILALVNDITNLDAIAADLTNIDTVAGISSAVSAVADNAENINAVNANKTNIDTVAGDKANIDTVAGNTSNINTVAGISSAVTTLAGISATLTALNDSLTAINGVYDDLSKIESVYTALPEVEAVYAALSDIGAVADALTAISSVAAALTTLANIEDNLTTLLAVGADLTNLDSLAADLTNLDSIANNLTEILQASTYASQAAASASNAQIWAEGTDQQVVPLGGQHSAKVWAQYIEEIIAGTRIYGGTFDSTTATATLTSSAKAKLGVTSDSIVLTNDNTAITGYGANEGIEYYVAVEGTFASLTLHEGDILWSTGSAWKKIDNSVTVIPDATESVKGIAALASTAEAETGLNDTKIMTPLKTATAIEADVLKGTTDPTTATTGYVGQTYLNTVDESVWKCTKTYTDYVTGNTKYILNSISPVTDSSGTRWLEAASNAGYLTVSSNGSTALTYSLKTKEPFAVLFKIYTGIRVDPISASFSFGLGASTSLIATNKGIASLYGTDSDLYHMSLGGNIALPSDTVVWVKRISDGTHETYGYIVDNGYNLRTVPGGISNDFTGWTSNTIDSTMFMQSTDKTIWFGASKTGSSAVTSSFKRVSGFNPVWKVDLDSISIVLGGNTYESVELTPVQRYTWTKLSNASSVYTKSEVDTALADKQDTLTAGTGINISSDTVTATAMTGADGTNAGTLGAVPAPAATDNKKFLRGDGTWGDALWNTATGSYALTVHGNGCQYTGGVNVGYFSRVTGVNGTAIGYMAKAVASSLALGWNSNASDDSNVSIGANSVASGLKTVALGAAAQATGKESMSLGVAAVSSAAGAIQIGRGTNNTAGTLQVSLSDTGTSGDYNNYQLLNSSGKVPTGRYIAMTGADGTNAGTIGAVPAPSATDNTKFLRGDGTWAEAGGGGSASYDSTTQEITLG